MLNQMSNSSLGNLFILKSPFPPPKITSLLYIYIYMCLIVHGVCSSGWLSCSSPELGPFGTSILLFQSRSREHNLASKPGPTGRSSSKNYFYTYGFKFFCFKQVCLHALNIGQANELMNL